MKDKRNLHIKFDTDEDYEEVIKLITKHVNQKTKEGKPIQVIDLDSDWLTAFFESIEGNEGSVKWSDLQS